MADFATKARTWQRISSSGELASRLGNVQPQLWRGYQYAADPPCHSSDGRSSFLFGDAPGGGITLTCWACLDKGSNWNDWIDRIEERLGVAIQVRYSSGNYRYRVNAIEAAGHVPVASVQRQVVNDGLMVEFQDYLMVRDMLALPIWFPGIGKKGWTVRVKGETCGWRQSKDDAEGGLALARFGGSSVEGKLNRRITIKPWVTYQYCVNICEWAAKAGYEGVRPVLGMGGSKDTPAPHSLFILDVDYKPSKDLEGEGLRHRDALQARYASAGLSLYHSNSGNGFHAVGQISGEGLYGFTRNGETIHKVGNFEPLGMGTKETTGLSIDLFLPGARFLVAVNIEKPGGGNAPMHQPSVLFAEHVRKLMSIVDSPNF